MLVNLFNTFFKKNKINHNEGFSPLPKNIVKDFNKTRPVKARDHLCNAPFRNMYLTLEGDVFVCCYNQKQNLGNIRKKTIKEIWNSENLKNIRHHINNFDLISGCDECKYLLQSGQYKSTHISSYDNYTDHDEYPTYLEFQFSNICNLECIMCTGDYSTTIATRREKRCQQESPYGHDFLLQLEEIIPYLKHTLFSGGEPFITPVYFQIWELIRKINPACNIMVQTNGTVLNDKVKKVLEGGKFNIGISLDSLNEDTYKEIRVNASLPETLNNIMFFKEYCHLNKTIITISVCPMQQNWHEMPDIVDFCNKHSLKIYFNIVWFPGKNALWVLDSQKIKEIISNLSEKIFNPETQIQKNNVLAYKNLINTLINWHKAAFKWENYKPKDVTLFEIEKLEIEIIQRIQNYITNISDETEEEKFNKANIIIAKLRKTFDRIPNNELKLKSLQSITTYKEDRIIANIFREDDDGLFLLINNLYRFRDL